MSSSCHKGSKLSAIANLIAGKDQKAIKNKFYSTLRRGHRKINSQISEEKRKSDQLRNKEFKRINEIFIQKLITVVDRIYEKKFEVKPAALTLHHRHRLPDQDIEKLLIELGNKHKQRARHICNQPSRDSATIKARPEQIDLLSLQILLEPARRYKLPHDQEPQSTSSFINSNKNFDRNYIIFNPPPIIMDNRLQRSSPLRKTSYFQKYRKELQRIFEEMRSKDHSGSLSDRSNKDSSHPSIPSNPPSQPQRAPPPQNNPIKIAVKKVPVFEAQPQKQAQKIQSKPEIKQQPESGFRQDEEEMREVQLLMGEVQAAKGKLSRCEQQISSKRNTLQQLKREVAGEFPLAHNAELQGYTQKMLAIETRMKFKKQLHEDELNRLANERNQRHSENVQLSKLFESLEEELQALTAENLKQQQLAVSLQAQVSKLQSEIARINQECTQVELKINNSQQLQVLSMADYKRYSEVYRRELVGREVAQAEQRVKERNNQKRYLVEIQRKKMLLRDRKVQNGVRQKALIQLSRVIDFVTKQISGLNKELNTLTDKSSFFNK